MQIDGAALGTVFVIAIVAVAILTTVFSYGVRSLSDRVTAREAGGAGTAALTAAIACFAVCGLIVAYGIYLIVS